ncbi:MAG: leucine-rich repeat domain-containing protein [Bacteroidales bacterium]|nr:leucine-rich repeat domain-containing protein [Bacteroidales bacterium]
MKRKLLLLFALMAIGLSGAWAYDFSAVAPSGQTLYYNIVGGNAQVTYYNSGSPSYPNLTGALVIPATVTYNGTTYTVTSIGGDAFYGCSGLTSVTIPNSVTSIGNYAFDYCTGLTSVTIPSSVTSIGSHAFYNCSGLASVTIPNSVTTIGGYVFYNCSGLTSVTIPNSVTSIGSSAFYGCSGLTSVTIPNSVTSIGNSAFYGCSNVDTLYYNARNLTTSEYWYYSDYNFYGFRSMGLNHLVIGDSVQTLPAGVFYGQSSLTSIIIPNSVTSIGEAAFAGCSGLTSVYIPSSVTTIGRFAFYDCSGLTSVTIPNSVTSIGYEAFFGCSGLTSIIVESGNTYYDSRNNCNAIIETNTNKLIAGCKNTIIPNSVTSIGSDAFGGCSGLTSVTIPNSVTSIEDHAFSGCSGLTSVTIPSSVTTIGGGAFAYCSGLTSVTIPNSVTSIGYYAFSGIKVVYYCGSATGDWGAFHVVCSFYEEGDFIFEDDTKTTILAYIGSATSVTIPNSVTSIGIYAFYGCSNVDTLYYNARNLTTTSDWYYSSSSWNYFGFRSMGLNHLVIGDSVQTLPAGVFYGQNSLTSVTIPNSVTSIETYAFYGCSGLASVTIPNSVTSIGEYAFNDCSGLTSLTIPNSVTSIGEGAFSYCTGLTEITSEAITAPLLGEYAFNGVNPMIPVNIPCGRMLSYMSCWSYFSNFVEGAGYSFEATSDNPAMGYVTVLTQPTCSAPQAVVNAVAIPGYRFDHWSNGSTANPYSFTLSQNTSLVAYFAVAARDTVFVHDTTFVNVFVPVHDTTFIDNYIHDTTIVNNYIHDTTTVTQWQYDTTYVNVYVPVHDTTFIDNYIHDTTIVNNYIHDTAYVDVYIHDTTFVEVLVHDTITITEELNWYALSVVSGNSDRGFVAGNGRFPENTEVEIAAIPIIGSRFVQWQDGNTDNPRTVSVENDMSFVATFDVAEVGVTDVETMLYSIYAQDGRIVVENASDAQIRIFDTLGRCISTTKGMEQVRVFNMPASGAYMVQVGNCPAQKVVVIK